MGVPHGAGAQGLKSASTDFSGHRQGARSEGNSQILNRCPYGILVPKMEAYLTAPWCQFPMHNFKDMEIVFPCLLNSCLLLLGKMTDNCSHTVKQWLFYFMLWSGYSNQWSKRQSLSSKDMEAALYNVGMWFFFLPIWKCAEMLVISQCFVAFISTHLSPFV